MTARVLLAALAGACLAGPAAGPRRATAGIVNLQSILATEADEGLSGSLTGSIDWRTGNVSYLSLAAAPVARYRSGDHLVVAIARGERKTSAGDTLVSSLFEHLRYRRQALPWLAGEAFGQHEYDAVRRLELRALAGAGPRVELVRGERAAVAIGVAYMIELERLRDDGEVDAGDRDLAHRASSYLVGRYQLDDRVQLVATVYAQPRIDRPSDVRLLDENQVVVKLGSRLALLTSFVLAYDSQPPATVDTLDSALTSSISWEF